MKKHIFPLLIAVVILLTGMVFTAQAAQIPADVEWIELDSEEDFIEWFGGSSCKNLKQDYTAGMTRYYKLTDDITITSNSPVFYMSYVGSSASINVNVYLDLNGKTLTYDYTPAEGNATRFMGNYHADATCTIVNGTMVNNSPIAGSHGGFFTVSKGRLVMEDVIIKDQNDCAMASNIFGKIIGVASGSSAELTNVTITSASSKALGKGLIRSQGELTMTDCSVTASTAGNMAAGGILYVNGGTTILTDCTFTGGNGKTGGAIYAAGTSTAPIALSMTGCTFSGADSTSAGGTMYAQYTDLTITDCDFTGSSSVASTYGGILYLEGSPATISGSTFTNGKAQNGGALYSVNKPVTIKNCTFTGGQATKQGGNIQHKNSEITLIDSTISGGKASVSGGNISISNAAKAYFKSGTISGGTAPNGGNIATAITGGTTGPTLYFQGMNITGGTATGNGGNLYIVADAGYAGNPAVHFSAGTITDGTATGNGGNVYLGGLAKEAATADKEAIAQRLVSFTMTGGTIGGTPAQGKEYAGEAANGGGLFATYATVNISSGTISNGHASAYGGNLYPSTLCTMTISGNTLVSGGTAISRGGNIYISSTNTVVNIQSGTVQNGISYLQGGNIYHGNGKLTITGGTITGGFSESSGGNIYAGMGYGNSKSASGTLSIKDDGNADTPLPQIIGGGAGLDGGNIYINCGGNTLATGFNKLVLGNFILSGGSAAGVADNLYINGIAILEILPEFSQEISCYISDMATGMLPEIIPGSALANNRGISSGEFTGKLTVENLDDIFIYAKEGDTNLYFASAAIVADGAKTWYKTNAEAVAAYSAGTVLQAGPGQLTLEGGDYTVDLAGNTVAITGTGNVTVFDSANDTFELYGSATIDGPTLVNEKLQTVNGKQYYTLAVAGTYTFHRVELTLITASLRPSIGGIYYTGRWSCDEAIKPHIGNFGVAASIVSMPESNFAELPKPTSKWTVFEAADFESGITKTGVMISGILKDAGDNATPDRIAMNAEYGQKKVHAVAYLNIDGVNYVGGGLSYSLYDILKIVSDNIEDYSDKAETLQSFMTHWSANGLVGEPWDSLDFQVSQDVLNLNKLYGGLQPYYGELHDHAATGGTSDGKQPLTVWKEELGKLKMDFATIVDHRQSLHMYLPEWDNSIFIGGSEAACRIKDRTGVFLHYNMIFSDPAGLEAVVSQFPEFNYREWTEEDRAGTGGQMHFDYPALTAARFTEVCNAVYANGGFVSLVHPKSDGYISSEDPADAYFREGTAIEVFYTYNSTRDGWHVKANYELWTSMIKAGYKVYASAGNDEHNMPSDKAVSVIYAEERSADAWVRQMRNGTFVPGGVGVRSAVGDTIMGGTTAFAGQRFTFSVGDFHSSIYNPDHTYRVDVLDQNGVVFSREVSCAEVSYFAFDADNASNYYYIEVHDVTTGTLLAIGNPIWNADK